MPNSRPRSRPPPTEATASADDEAGGEPDLVDRVVVVGGLDGRPEPAAALAVEDLPVVRTIAAPEIPYRGVETGIVHPDGGVVWVRVTTTPLLDP